MRCALIVTANRYAHYNSLRYCHTDGHLLQKTLIGCCDYDRNCEVRHVKLDRQEAIDSPEALLAVVRELDLRARAPAGGDPAQDSFLFYFAGHGLFDEVAQTSYLLLPNSRPDALGATALSIRELRTALGSLGRPVIQIVDACHSGQAFRGRGGEADAAAPNLRGFVTDLKRNVDRVEEAGRAGQLGWEMLASCDEDEHSYEDDELRHGIFTLRLTEAIRGCPPGSDVLLATLKDPVCEQVRDWAHGHGIMQHPVFAARTFGRHAFARRNRLPQPSLAPPRPPRPRDREPTRHVVRLPARRASEVELDALLLRGGRAQDGHRLRMRVDFEPGQIFVAFDAAPHLIKGGRSVPRPIFRINPDHTICAGPYDWHKHRIRLSLDEHQALITSVDLDGNQSTVSVVIP